MDAADAASGARRGEESMVDSSGNSSVGVHGDGLPIGMSSFAPICVPSSVFPPPVCVPCMGSSSMDDPAGAGGCDCEPDESGPGGG